MSTQAVTMPKAVRVIPAKPEYSGKSNADFRPKRVAAYCRVSTDKEEQEHSFETQKEMYTDMVKYFQCKNCVGSSLKTKKCVASFLVHSYSR